MDPDVDVVARRLWDYRHMGHYAEGGTYFNNLEERCQKHPLVVFEICHLYCRQGMVNFAIEILDSVGFDVDEATMMVQPPEVLCLIIFRAYLNVLADRLSRTGLKIVELFKARRSALSKNHILNSRVEVSGPLKPQSIRANFKRLQLSISSTNYQSKWQRMAS
jgi:hypothetical protein